MGDIDSTTTLRRAAPVAATFERPGLSLRVEPDLGIAKLRLFYGEDADARFREIVGIAPPGAGAQVEADGLAFAWLAPGEWLVLGPGTQVAAWLAPVADRGGDTMLAVDLGHARTAFLLEGVEARTALAAHCPLDLWAEAFPVGAVARSLLGETGLFIARLDDGGGNDGAPRFRIIVDQTMAAYAARLLAGA